MITERDFLIILALARYFVLNHQQIQRLVFPQDEQGRITRRRLQALVSEKLINRQALQFYHPSQSPAPVYFPARKGVELLAEHFSDQRFLTTPTQSPVPHHTFHWLAVSDTHITFDEAIKRQSLVTMDGWINEWDIVNKDESAPEKRFRLYTLLRENPRLVCAPDSAFLLSVKGRSKIFYLEQDRATSGVTQIAASKTPGYAALAQSNLHRRHFAASTENFSVLMVAPTERRRDALRKAIEDRPSAALWRFATATDLMPDKVFFEPVWFSCHKAEPDPLVKQPTDESASGTTQPTSVEAAS